MKYLRNKLSTLLAVGALALGSLAITPPKAAAQDAQIVAVCVTAEVCGTACAFGYCVTLCVSATVCV